MLSPTAMIVLRLLLFLLLLDIRPELSHAGSRGYKRIKKCKTVFVASDDGTSLMSVRLGRSNQWKDRIKNKKKREKKKKQGKVNAGYREYTEWCDLSRPASGIAAVHGKLFALMDQDLVWLQLDGGNCTERVVLKTKLKNMEGLTANKKRTDLFTMDGDTLVKFEMRPYKKKRKGKKRRPTVHEIGSTGVNGIVDLTHSLKAGKLLGTDGKFLYKISISTGKAKSLGKYCRGKCASDNNNDKKKDKDKDKKKNNKDKKKKKDKSTSKDNKDKKEKDKSKYYESKSKSKDSNNNNNKDKDKDESSINDNYKETRRYESKSKSKSKDGSSSNKQYNYNRAKRYFESKSKSKDSRNKERRIKEREYYKDVSALMSWRNGVYGIIGTEDAPILKLEREKHARNQINEAKVVKYDDNRSIMKAITKFNYPVGADIFCPKQLDELEAGQAKVWDDK